MSEWKKDAPKLVSRLVDINERVKIVTEELVKRTKQKLETLKQIMEQRKEDG